MLFPHPRCPVPAIAGFCQRIGMSLSLLFGAAVHGICDKVLRDGSDTALDAVCQDVHTLPGCTWKGVDDSDSGVRSLEWAMGTDFSSARISRHEPCRHLHRIHGSTGMGDG